MSRPSNWYTMSWEEQRNWERNEEQHRRELQDAEDAARRAADDEARYHERQMRAARQERDGLRDDYETACESARRAEAFIAAKGLTTEYETWEEPA